MALEVASGDILAMVGSKNYFEPHFGNYNVTTALRQPGSSIKPITYITAFKSGYSPGNTVLDTPVNFSDQWGNSYAPVNYDGTFHGPISVRTALGSSYNIPAVKMLALVGVENMIQTARNLGITTLTDPKRYGLALTLGAGEVKMVELMGVYGALAQNGVYRPITPIVSVKDSEGNILEEFKDNPRQAIEAEIAYLITDILKDNKARTPAFGPNSLLNIDGYQIAVKTGTSDNKRDNWTFGYTPEFVIGVWVGNNNNTPMHPLLTSGVTGASPIWNRITKSMLARISTTDFKRPSGIVETTIDGRRDLIASKILPKRLVQTKKEGERITLRDPFSRFATSSASLDELLKN